VKPWKAWCWGCAARIHDRSQAVEEKLKALQPLLPEGTTLKTFYSRGSLVERAVGTVSTALLEAIVLVMILLFIFLGHLRAAIVVALILPLSALATFLAMRFYGLSANLMSLGGLAIAIGMLVDAAVVIVENIEAHQSQAHGGAALSVACHLSRCTGSVAAGDLRHRHHRHCVSAIAHTAGS
jgi:cobalt-zinc-cadmium resistance protein CzcA